MKPIAQPDASPTLIAALDPLARTVLAHADGTRSAPQIATAAAATLGQPVAPWQVHGALDVLRGAGLIAEDQSPSSGAVLGALRGLGATATAAALLAIGVVPAHASDPDKDEKTEEVSEKAPDPETDPKDDADKGDEPQQRPDRTRAEEMAKKRAMEADKDKGIRDADKRSQQEKHRKAEASRRSDGKR